MQIYLRLFERLIGLGRDRAFDFLALRRRGIGSSNGKEIAGGQQRVFVLLPALQQEIGPLSKVGVEVDAVFFGLSLGPRRLSVEKEIDQGARWRPVKLGGFKRFDDLGDFGWG